MHRSYVPKEWISCFSANKKHPLPKDVAARFFSVLRIKAHEEVAVFDGCGREVIGLLTKNPDQTVVFLQASLHVAQPSKPQIILVQAATEEGKMAETVRRGCEYGIDQLIIFNGERSEKFSFNKLQKREQRLWHIAEDACRQSGRLFIPSLSFASSIAAFQKEKTHDLGLGIFGDLLGYRLLSKILAERGSFTEDFIVVVGPEGGLSVNEKEELIKGGFLSAKWAPFTLRCELAGLAAIAIFNAYIGKA
jgi:16S rRNA (uracil1498-N3)-methyltransferase